MVELKKKYLDNFIKGINKDFKWDFEAFYQDSRYDIDGFSFLHFYKSIIKRSNNVIDEIKENLLFMSAEKHISYLNYVEERIKRDVVANVDSSFLNKWIKKYDVKNLEFPFTENPDLKIILSIAVDEYKGFVSSENQLTIQVQKDFHKYTYYLEKNKIIDFIDRLLSIENKSNKAYKNEKWFNVGVKLASGQMDKYYTINSKGEISLKDSYTSTIVAKELGDIKCKKEILATLNDYSPDNPNANKNIFNSRVKMLKIKSHCEEENIPVISYFIKRLPPE